MFSKLIRLFFLWRKNDLPSIVFKSLFWGSIAWLGTGIFTELRTALIGGLAAALLAACKYTLQNRKENTRLLAMVDGDQEKLKALRKKMSAKGMAGGLITEMLRAEMPDDDDEDDEEYAELSEEQKAQNVAAAKAAIDKLSSLCIEGCYVDAEQGESIRQELMSNYADGEDVPELIEMLHEFLPENVLEICTEGFCNEDDHAALVEEFAQATNGKWTPENFRSEFDEEKEQWAVNFSDAGEDKTWRFQQSGDWLSEKFLQQLIAYTEAKSGHKVTVLDSEDSVSAVCLPLDLHHALFDQDQALAA